jgi:transposase
MTAADLASTSREQLIDVILSQDATNNRLQEENTELQHRLAWLERQLFGEKSERFVPNDQQLSLELDEQHRGDSPTSTERITYDRKVRKKQRGHGRGPMPTHLPIKDVTLEPHGDAVDGKHIGDEITWEYKMKRGSLYVQRYIRPKYAGSDSEGVVIAPLPPRPIEKGNAGPSLLAHIIVEKYLYHMPLDRQRRKFKTEYQVDFPESTLCDWVRQSCFWFDSVYDVLVKQVQNSSYIQADETPVPVLTRDKRGKTHRGYFWVYHTPVENITVFVYSKSRARAGPNEFLKDFKGTLQVDGYTGYNEVLSKQRVVWAACMAHVRRNFEDALKSSREEATYALEAMKQWFAVEAESKDAGLDYDQRLAVRKDKIGPSMEQFHIWLKEQVLAVLPKSPLGKAVAYALNQWKGFEPFLNDGRIELSNNWVENKIRPVALGRKNYMFKGSHDAAQRGAMIYSLCATAQMNNIDPYIYFTDILERLPAAKASDIADFTPANWKPLYMNEAIRREQED